MKYAPHRLLKCSQYQGGNPEIWPTSMRKTAFTQIIPSGMAKPAVSSMFLATRLMLVVESPSGRIVLKTVFDTAILSPD